MELREHTFQSGIAPVAVSGNTFYYWSFKLTTQTIRARKFIEITHKVIQLITLLIGAGGIIAFGYHIYLHTAANQPFLELLDQRSIWLTFFWVSLLVDAYLFYRLKREVGQFKEIPYLEKHHSLKTQQTNWCAVDRYYSPAARKVVMQSLTVARKYKQRHAQTIHLFIALLGSKTAQSMLTRLSISSKDLLPRLQAYVQSLPSDNTATVSEVSSGYLTTLIDAFVLAYTERQKNVDVAELFESVVKHEQKVQEILYDIGVTEDQIHNMGAWLRVREVLLSNWQRFRKRASLKPSGAMNRSMTAIATPMLNSVSTDLTLLARAGYLMPCIGREKEINDLVTIMSGGTRRSVILIGEPGIGKTTIIEGLAQLMVEEFVPDFLQDKRLVLLDTSRLLSGGSVSDVQQRLLIALNEIRKSGNIILAIPDIHTITGVSLGDEGSLDVGGVLAKVLDAGTVIALGTTTTEHYRRHIESSHSLGSVMEPYRVPEVDTNAAIRILQSKVGSIEYNNKVYFSYQALAAVVEYAQQFMHDRSMPEVAIELLQEVAVNVGSQRKKQQLLTEEDVARVVSEKTNIPLTQLKEDETEKLLHLEERIHERIIGQHEAVATVATALRRARTELRDEERPIVNLLFLGPTGVGKTELAKTVAYNYFGSEDAMVRLDMSEFQNTDSIYRLIGSSDGSLAGQLTEAVRKNPFCLVLLDELEKAHPDVLNLFLQAMDDGRLTTAAGKTIKMNHVIFIATSNAGTDFIQQEIKKNTPMSSIHDTLIDSQLQRYFRPEFLNRFDSIVVFKPLNRDEVKEIALLMLNDVRKQLSEKGLNLEVTDAALTELASKGYDPSLGARPLRRVIQDTVQAHIARIILEQKPQRRDTLVVDSGEVVTIRKGESL